MDAVIISQTHMHFTTRKSAAEHRLLSFGFEQFPGSNESSRRRRQPRTTPQAHGNQSRAERAQKAKQRTQQEAAEQRTDEQAAERRLQEEVLKSDLTKLLKAHADTLANWRTVSDAVIRDFKEGLRQALSLPKKADFLVRPIVDRGSTTIEVYDRQNPLHLFARFSQPHGGQGVDRLRRDVPLSEQGNIDRAVQQIFGLGSKFQQRSLDVQLQAPNQVTLVNSETGQATLSGNPYTQLKLIDRATGLELGTLQYDETQHLVKDQVIHSDHVEMIAHPRLTHFREQLAATLNEQGPQQKLAQQAVLNEMLAAAQQHRPLIEQFTARRLLLVTDSEGDKVTIRVFDKQSGLEISDLEYNTQLDQIGFGPVLYLAKMRKALSEKPE